MFSPKYFSLIAWLHSSYYLFLSHWISGRSYIIQFGLLYIQQRYGSKKVIPRFMLEPVFNYKLEDINVEEGG